MKLLLIFAIISLIIPLVSLKNIIVIAGGGPGGEVGNKEAWNYELYRKLIPEKSLKKQDSLLKICVLTGYPDPTDYLPNYFMWLGTEKGFRTDSRNYKVETRSDANNPNLVGPIQSADVIFISGGDQGQYYHEWNGTLLHENIKKALGKGANIGGTSAGSMILAQFSFSGGTDLITPDILEDAKSDRLNDAIDHKSAIHTDFLPLVKNAVIDTHVTERVRLGRLLGILAKAIDDTQNHEIIGIGLEQTTGLYIHDNIAEVFGIGTVNIIRETSSTYMKREKRQPLLYTDLQFDRLTEGWRLILPKFSVDYSKPPKNALPVSYSGDSDANYHDLSIRGEYDSDTDKFDNIISYLPDDYQIRKTSMSDYIKNAFGMTRCYDEKSLSNKEESLFRAIYDKPNFLGFLLHKDSAIYRTNIKPDIIESGGYMGFILIDAKTANYKSLSPHKSPYAIQNGKLIAAGLTNMRVHVIGNSRDFKYYYDTRKRIFINDRP